MPIYSLEGTPGSGKTLYCVQKIIPDFLRIRDASGNLVPRHIYTNIEGLKPWLICAFLGVPYESIAEYFHPLGQVTDEQGRTHEDKDYVRYWFFKPQTIEWTETINSNKQLERIPDWDKAEQIENGSLVIIDEIQNYYSNRDFATTYSKRVIDYITKNRHYGWTLIWMSQSVESVDVTFRRNTEQVWFLERLENYGRRNTSSVKKYEGWLAGNKTNIDPFARETFSFDKRYFACYSSYVQGVQAEKRYRTNVFLNSKMFVGMAILFVVCIVAAIALDPIDTISGKKRQKPTAAAGASATAPTPLSFSGAGEPKREEHTQVNTNDTLCVKNSFVLKNLVYVVLNDGQTKQVRGGEHYEECAR